MSNARDLADLGKSAEAIDVDASAPADSLNIDSSGNVLVGKTASGTTTAGFEARANGQTVATIDGGTALIANRETSDGDIIRVMKDGGIVGSIGTRDSGALEIGSGDVYLQFNGANDWIKPVDGSGNNKSGVDLGTSGARFDNLYLSGGIYLGGTGGANHLDDYEEGTWTPATNEGTLTYEFATYTKVGRIVVVSAFLYNFSNTTSGNGIRITGLPFTSSSNQRSVGSTMMQQISTNTIDNAYISNNSSELAFYATTTGSFVHMKHSDLNSSSSEIYVTMTYRTDS